MSGRKGTQWYASQETAINIQIIEFAEKVSRGKELYDSFLCCCNLHIWDVLFEMVIVRGTLRFSVFHALSQMYAS